jgi:hypothetical protein
MSYKLVCFYDIERDKFLCVLTRKQDYRKIFFWTKYAEQARDNRSNIFWLLVGREVTIDSLINDELIRKNSGIASEVITKLEDRRDTIIMVGDDGDGGFDFIGEVS